MTIRRVPTAAEKAKRMKRAKARARSLRRGANKWGKALKAASNEAWKLYRGALASRPGATRPTKADIFKDAKIRMALNISRLKELQERAASARRARTSQQLQEAQGLAVKQAVGSF